jgi:hypothetical protein
MKYRQNLSLKGVVQIQSVFKEGIAFNFIKVLFESHSKGF